jgi:hypothetical protein
MIATTGGQATAGAITIVTRILCNLEPKPYG